MRRKRKAGQQPFQPKAAHRRMVKQNIAGGLSEDKCAIAMGISTPTLRKYFAAEIEFGRAHAQSELLELMWRQARAGKVSAIEKLMKRADTASAEADFLRPQQSAGRPAQRLGKKEEAAIAATTAGEGTDWGEDLQIPASGPN